MSIFNTIAGGLQVAGKLFGGNDSKSRSRAKQSSSSSGSNSNVSSSRISGTSSEEIAELLETSLNSTQQQSTTQTEKTSGTSDSKRQESTAQTETSDSTSTGTEESAQTTFGFEEELMGELNSLLSSTIAGGGGLTTGQSAINQRLNSLGGSVFDVDGFVNGIMSDARATARGELETGVNIAESAVGGTERTNSMAALLGNRLRNDTASRLSGIESEATARGAQIRAGESTEIGGLANAGTEGVLGLIQSLAGAQTQASGLTETQLAEQQQAARESQTDAAARQSQRSAGSSTANTDTTATQTQRNTGTRTADRAMSETANTISSGSQTSNVSQTNSRSQTNPNGKSKFQEILDLFTESSINA